jgi:hypothetical protein
MTSRRSRTEDPRHGDHAPELLAIQPAVAIGIIQFHGGGYCNTDMCARLVITTTRSAPNEPRNLLW